MGNLSGFVKRLRDIMRNDAGINGDAQRIEQIAWMLFLKVYDAKEQDWEFDDKDYVSIIPEQCRWANWAHDDKSGSAMTGDTLLNFVNNTLFPVLKGNDIKDSNGKILIEGVKVTADTPIKKAIVKTTFEDANQYMKDGVLLRQIINVIDDLDLSDYEESHAFNEIYESILKELQSAGSAGEFYTPRAVTDFMAKMIEPKIGEKMADFACGTGGFITSWLNELQTQIKSTADAKKYGESIFGIEKKQFPYMLCIRVLFKNIMGQWYESVLSNEIAWLEYKNSPERNTHNVNENTIPPQQLREGDSFRAVMISPHYAPFSVKMQTVDYVNAILEQYAEDCPEIVGARDKMLAT